MNKIVNKALLLLSVILVTAGQAFGAGEKCAANTTWGEFKTVIATKGTDGYYEIDTPAKLAWFACEVSKYTAESVKLNAKLMQSINMEGKLFIPISAGKGTPSFGGIFNGQGFSIKNLFIDASEIAKSNYGGNKNYVQNVGLFATLNGGNVQDLSLENVSIYAASSAGDAGTQGKENPISVGAVVGFMKAGTIDGCAVSGKIETSGSTNRVGGIAGNVWSATISNSISEVNIFATGNDTHVGGIVGALRNEKGKSELPVEISSCAYAGETLFSNNGSVGAIAGNYEKAGIVNNGKDTTVTTSDLYYTADYPAVGTGLGNKPFADTNKVESLNTEDVICELNGGSWDMENNTCSGASADGEWSEGQDNISMNGSDGFKISFDPNGGVFPEGAQTFKFFAKGATITANEIENPTYGGKKFAGWSLTQGGDVQDLGSADKAKTIYAVWKPIRTITFKTAPGTFVGGSNEETTNVAEGDVITVEGLPALPEKFCTQETEGNCDKYAYFQGWSTQENVPFSDENDIPEGTIVNLTTFTFNKNETLYAVWVESETYTVTFNANGHGQTSVAFVKVGRGERTVQPADPSADDGYVFTGRWCEVIPCNDNTKFDFENTEIGRNIILYADWSVPEYTITYMINGEVSTTTGNVATYDVESDPITLAKPTRDGHVFDGWYDEDGNEASVIHKGSTGNKTFHGAFIPVKYTITYLSDNTLAVTEMSDEKYHGVAKILKGATYVHGGCVQDGWSKISYDKSGYNLDYVVGGSYEEDENVILFPHWNCNTYTITYKMFGAAATNRNPDEYTGPAKITLENAFDPNKKDFFMDNWYKESTFKTTIRDIQNINADLTLYAKWYNKITYKPGKYVSGAKDSTYKKYFDSTYTFKSSITTYTRENYTLDGWSTTDGGEKVYGLGDTYTKNENLMLYPHWVEKRDSVQYGAVKIYTYATDGRREAVINGEYDGTDAVALEEDIEVASVVWDRDFGGVPATITLPFEIDVANVEGAKFYNFGGMATKEDGKKAVQMNRVKEGKLAANTPYGVRPTGSTITFNGPVTFKKTEEASVTVGEWKFVGLFAKYVVTESDEGRLYGFAGESKDGISQGKFVRFYRESSFKALRAYMLNIDEASPTNMSPAPGLFKSASINRNIVSPLEMEVEWIDDEEGTMNLRKSLNAPMIFKSNKKFDLKGRSVGEKSKAKGAYYDKGGRN